MTLELKGSFTLVTGELWSVGFDLDGGSSLRVEGSVVLRRNSRRIFEGPCVDPWSSGPPVWTSTSKIDVEVELDQEVEVAGIDPARVWTSTTIGAPAPSTLAVELGLLNGVLSITAASR